MQITCNFFIGDGTAPLYLTVLLTVYSSLTKGKLGHGDTNRVYKPKAIDGLQGLVINKVCCGSQFSLALTSTGLVSVMQLMKYNKIQ